MSRYYRFKDTPGGPVQVSLDQCQCADRRGPLGGVCGNCAGAIPQNGEAEALEDSVTGFDSHPARYTVGDRETCDLIRDELGDERFIGYCLGNAMKYESRAGKKGPAEEDLQKARWYREMASHVMNGTPDPRQYLRKDFVPYNRPGT